MALSKINRNSLNTGISDSSDATAVTIDSSEKVLIGNTSDGDTTGLSVNKAGGGNFIAHFRNTTTGTPYGVKISAPSGDTAGYPLLYIGDHASEEYFKVQNNGIVNMPLQPRLSVWKYQTQTVAHNTYVKVALDGTNRIANGMTGFTQSNSHTRWTVATAGDYYVAASMRWYTNSAVSTSLMDIYKNGSRLTFGYDHTLDNYAQLHANGIFTLAANDYLELVVYQYSGSTQTLNAQDNTIMLNAYKIS